jgi:predicted ferric reductase
MLSQKAKTYLQGAFWIFIYLALITGPLFIMLLTPVPMARGFWYDFSVALGFAGLAMLLIQFALTARFKHVKAPFGSDIIYHFHRQISLVAIVIILAHPLIIFITVPSTIHLLNVLTAPWRARFAVASLLALIILIVTSLFRKQLRIEYDLWRVAHGTLAVGAVGLALTHMLLVGHFVGAQWKSYLWIAYGIFWVFLLIHVRLIRPLVELRQPWRVKEVNQERGRSWTLVLQPEGHKGLTFEPGQFAWLTIRRSPFSLKEHPFSLSSSAERPDEIRFTIKELGDFTKTINGVKPGERIYLDGAYGAFSVDRYPRAPGFGFIAGGIGITPVMSNLRTLADRNDTRPLLLFYANRSWEDVTFREEIERLKETLNLKLVHVLNDPPEGWKGETGYIDAEMLKRHLPEDFLRYEYFICGPGPMMDAAEQTLSDLGVPLRKYHSERFDLV